METASNNWQARLTPGILRIPEVLASRMCRGDRALREDLISEGNLALVISAQRFDPSKREDGEAGFRTFVWSYVKWYLWNRLNKKTDPAMELIDGAADHSAPDAALEAEEDQARAAKALRVLDPISRMVYRLFHGEGLSAAEIAERLAGTLTRHQVRRILLNARRSVKASVAAQGRTRFTVPPPPPRHRSEKQKRAVARHRRQRAVADRIRGAIPAASYWYYLADDQARRLLGPWETLGAALASLGLSLSAELPPHSGCRPSPLTLKAVASRLSGSELLGGLRLLKGPEARRLAEVGGYRLVVEPEQLKHLMGDRK